MTSSSRRLLRIAAQREIVQSALPSTNANIGALLDHLCVEISAWIAIHEHMADIQRRLEPPVAGHDDPNLVDEGGE